MNLLAGLGNDFNSGDQAVGLSSDNGAVQATSEGGNVTDVTFVDNCIVEERRTSKIDRKAVPIVSIFDLILECKLYVPF